MFCVEVHTSKGFPGGSDSEESTWHAGDLGLIPGLERSPGEGHGNPLQYSCLENSYGQRSLTGYSPWGCKESDVTEWLSTAQHTSNRYRVEEGVGLALEALEVPRGSDRLIPGLERSPGGGLGNPFQYSCLENSYGQRSLVGYSPWDCKELDMTKLLSTAKSSIGSTGKQNKDSFKIPTVRWLPLSKTHPPVT